MPLTGSKVSQHSSLHAHMLMRQESILWHGLSRRIFFAKWLPAPWVHTLSARIANAQHGPPPATGLCS
eukprot:216237-Chlamydomonas_euryale.AAC.1